MRNVRQNQIDRTCCYILREAGKWLVGDSTLRTEVTLRVVPPPTTSETDDALRHLLAERRIYDQQSETGPKWQLTEVGHAWLGQNGG